MEEDGAVASFIFLSPASHARVFAVPYVTVHFLLYTGILRRRPPAAPV